MDVSPIALQRQMFWGLISQVEVLKVVAPDMQTKPFTPQREAQNYQFPSQLCITELEVGFMARLCLSTFYLF